MNVPAGHDIRVMVGESVWPSSLYFLKAVDFFVFVFFASVPALLPVLGHQVHFDARAGRLGEMGDQVVGALLRMELCDR